MSKSSSSHHRQEETSYEKWITNTRNVIPHLLFNCPFDFSTRPCLGTKRNGHFSYITYSEFKEKVRFFASSLISHGFNFSDKLVIMSENREEWVTSDIGTMLGGGIVVPIYPTLTLEQIGYIVNHCDAKFMVVSTQVQYNKVMEIVDKLDLLMIIVLDADVEFKDHPRTKSISIADFHETGKSALQKNDSEINQRLVQIEETDICSIIYTSGTTGKPKGVMLTHKNFIFSALNGIHIQYANQLRRGSIPRELSILPLSHVFARMICYSLVIISGGNIAFAENFNTIASDLQKVRPNLLAGVPRIYETIHNKIAHKLQKSSAAKKQIASWALSVGKAYFIRKSQNRRIGIFLSAQHFLAHKLVFSKLHELFGGNLEALLSAGAKLRKDIAMFYCSIGLPLTEGYGLTETSPTITCSRPSDIRWGSVGKAVRSVEVKIASDGEVLVKGDNVMSAYYENEEATQEAFDEEGWFHTGDLGQRDDEGFLEITGRKKEIIVMSNGENVAPSPIEDLIISSPYVEQAVLVGDNRPFISALIVPNFSAIKSHLAGKKAALGDNNAIASNPDVHKLIGNQIREVTQGKIAKYAQIRRFSLLKREFSAEQDELTPTLKIKRHVVQKRFDQEISNIYNN